jgi:hypothetical protein
MITKSEDDDQCDTENSKKKKLEKRKYQDLRKQKNFLSCLCNHWIGKKKGLNPKNVISRK